MANGVAHYSLGVPEGTTCVTVMLIDICSISKVGTKSLFTPPVPGFDSIGSVPSWIVLLEHPSGRKVLYDLGIRKDWEKLHPIVSQRLNGSTHEIVVDKDIDEYLDNVGIGKGNIDAVVWRYVSESFTRLFRQC
jgi:hypothetical protein